MGEPRAVRSWLWIGALAVVSQSALTTYPNDGRGTAVFWALVSTLLLWLVHRRSNLARTVFGVLAATGFAIFALASIDDLLSTRALLAALYGVQLSVVLAPPVRAWTRSPRPLLLTSGVE